jgi:uncharacterized membrane protein
MKPGDLVRFVWASGMSRRFAADTVGVLIERVRSYGSAIYYSVLVDGKIEVVHENELERSNKTQ